MCRLSAWAADDARLSAGQWERVRFWMVVIVLVGPTLPRLAFLAEVPEPLIEPGLRYPFGRLATTGSKPLLLALSLLGPALAALALTDRHARAGTLALAGYLVAANSVLFTLGAKIVSHHWVPLALGLLGLAGWRARSTWSARQVLAWIVAWGLWFSGLEKLRGGWLDPETAAVRNIVNADRVFFGAGDVETVLDAAAWELLDWATVVLELGVVVVLARPSWFRAAVGALVAFHLAVLVVVGIDFAPILPAYLPFLAAACRPAPLPESRRRMALAVLVPGAALAIVAEHRSLIDLVLDPGPTALRPLVSGAALVAVLVWMGAAGRPRPSPVSRLGAPTTSGR